MTKGCICRTTVFTTKKTLKNKITVCRSKLILNPPPPPPDVEAVDEGAKKAPDAKKTDGKKDAKKEAAEEAVAPPAVTSIFVPDIECSVQEFVAKWQDRDESMNFAQKYDPDLVKDELRPIVFEEIRLQVDEEMRILLENLKVRHLFLCHHLEPYLFVSSKLLSIGSKYPGNGSFNVENSAVLHSE